MTFNLPPPDYDVDVHGEWMGRRLIPLVALVGDALLEPFWPLGLGLKRGWQAIMDTCYAVDNLYNKEAFRERKGKEPESWTWDDHYEALAEQVAQNFELCNRLKVSEELGKGAYDEKGPVIMQLKKFNKDAEIPTLEVEVNPWTRYEVLAKETGDSWKTLMKDPDWVHPQVQKQLNKTEYYTKKGMSATGEFKYSGKKLVSVGGKTLPGKGGAAGGGAAAPEKNFEPVRRQPSMVKAPQLGDLIKANKVTIEEKAQASQASLQEKVMASKIEDHVKTLSKQNSTVGNTASRRKSTIDAQALSDVARNMEASLNSRNMQAGESVTDAVEGSWNRMQGKHLSIAQQAELDHVQNMIACLEKSLKQYRQAEQDLLMSK